MKERVQRLRAADDPRIALREPTLAKALRDAVERGLTEPAGCFIAIDSDGGIEGLIAFSEVDSQGRAYVELLHAAWHDEPTRIVRELLDASLSQLPVRPATLEYLLDERRGRGHGLTLLARATRHLARADGTTSIRADSDELNEPMRRCFERAGYTQFATRSEYRRAGI